MKRTVKYVVVPFRIVRGRPQSIELRKAETEQGAVRMAELMAERYAGAAAYEVIVDEESGEMHDPRQLAVFGRVQDLAAEAA